MLLLKILYIFWQWTWGFLQSLLGLIYLLLLGRQKHEWYGLSLMTVFDPEEGSLYQIGSVSLGMFIFVVGREGKANPTIAAHEYGHTFQSLLLGPLYLFLIGIPSSSWAYRYRKHGAAYAAKGIAYTSRYPENWAESWGRRSAVRRAIRANRQKDAKRA